MHGGGTYDWMEPECVRLGSTQSYVLITPESGASELASVPTGARQAVIRIVGDDIRYFVDGTDATGLDGMLLGYTQTLTLYTKEQMDDLRFVLASGGSGATVYVDYYTSD